MVVTVFQRVKQPGAGTSISGSFTKSEKRLRRRSRGSKPKQPRPQVLLLLLLIRLDSRWLMVADCGLGLCFLVSLKGCSLKGRSVHCRPPNQWFRRFIFKIST